MKLPYLAIFYVHPGFFGVHENLFYVHDECDILNVYCRKV